MSALTRSDRDLLAAFVEDRESLSTKEMDRLVFRCREDGEFLQALSKGVDNAALCDRLMAQDSVSFTDRVIGAVAEAKIPAKPHRRSYVPWMLAAGLLLGLGLGGWLAYPRPQHHGWSAHGGQVDLRQAGDVFISQPTRLEHQDGSLMTLQPGAWLSLGHKLVDLKAGEIHVKASKRASDDPLLYRMPDGLARIVGTAFELRVDAHGSILRVTEGLVEYQHPRSGVTRSVAAGQRVQAASASDQIIDGFAPPLLVNVNGEQVMAGNTTEADLDQDRDGWVLSFADGRGVELRGNTWKFFDLPYVISADTVVEFDYSGPLMGQFHAIGLVSSVRTTAIRGHTVQLAGANQSWGLKSDLLERIGPHRYRIPAGTLPVGPAKYLVVASDDDHEMGSRARFANIRIYER